MKKPFMSNGGFLPDRTRKRLLTFWHGCIKQGGDWSTIVSRERILRLRPPHEVLIMRQEEVHEAQISKQNLLPLSFRHLLGNSLLELRLDAEHHVVDVSEDIDALSMHQSLQVSNSLSLRQLLQIIDLGPDGILFARQVVVLPLQPLVDVWHSQSVVVEDNDGIGNAKGPAAQGPQPHLYEEKVKRTSSRQSGKACKIAKDHSLLFAVCCLLVVLLHFHPRPHF
mmetsp:Transcript_72978/g.173852  ORF Transcript_72978/g.173852 Transcript_72978/m.173852 type:complete len:224 (+) Transcript_72978:497-1168(+)